MMIYNMSNTNDKKIVELNDAKTFFINEQYMDYEFLPDVKIFKVHQ